MMTMTRGWEGCLYMKVKARFISNLSSPPHPKLYWVMSRSPSGGCATLSHSSDEFQAKDERNHFICQTLAP